LFELPGRSEKYCFECSADVATATLLTAEIDAATFAGQNASLLISEFEQLSTRILARSQSAELGSF
jgi:glycine cleavage system regulatory protein